MKIGEIPEEETRERKVELVRNRTLRNTTFLSWENWKSSKKEAKKTARVEIWNIYWIMSWMPSNATVSRKE